MDIDSALNFFLNEKAGWVSGHLFTFRGRMYPIYGGVYIFLNPKELPATTRQALRQMSEYQAYFDSWIDTSESGIDESIQTSFSEEWTLYDRYLQEFDEEFDLYFDLIDEDDYAGKSVVDLGCGIGRWASYLVSSVDCIVCVDFSEAIFVAAEKLGKHSNCFFVMADVQNLPFKERSFDLVYSLGVLHHLPVNAMDAVKRACEYVNDGGIFLGYLYYALDNRPQYFRVIFMVVDFFRRFLSGKITNSILKNILIYFIALFFYKPMIYLGHVGNLIGLGSKVPLYEFYKNKSFYRIRQDVMDRFFTAIEQRYTRVQISEYVDANSLGNLIFSDQIPYWHFTVKKCLPKNSTELKC